MTRAPCVSSSRRKLHAEELVISIGDHHVPSDRLEESSEVPPVRFHWLIWEAVNEAPPFVEEVVRRQAQEGNHLVRALHDLVIEALRSLLHEHRLHLVHEVGDDDRRSPAPLVRDGRARNSMGRENLIG